MIEMLFLSCKKRNFFGYSDMPQNLRNSFLELKSFKNQFRED